MVAIKLPASWAWCALGLRALAAPARGWRCAALPLALGVALGWTLTHALGTWMPAGGRHGLHLPSSAAALPVLRLREWPAIGLLARRSAERALLGRDARERWWRAGGVAVSFATDAA